MNEQSYRVGAEQAGQRLDRFLTLQFPDRSRSQIQRWIREDRVRVEGELRPARQIVEIGQTVTVVMPDPRPSRLQPADLSLEVVFEDDWIAIVDKPAGLQVHPGAGPAPTTMVHGLLHRYRNRELPGPPERPGIVHRLDRDTSGLLAVALGEAAYQHLSGQIRERQFRRRYLAIVWGSPDGESGLIDAPLERDPRDRRRIAVRSGGRTARTHWRIIRRFEHLTLLELRLETGRTHQIRVHCRHLGHPLVGDATYGQDAQWLSRVPLPERSGVQEVSSRLKRQALHAYHLALRHPSDGRWCRFESPLPTDMDEVLRRLSEREGTE